MKSNNNPTLVFLPGWGFDATIWQEIVESLAGYKCLMIDLPDYNNSIQIYVANLKKKIPGCCYQILKLYG